MWAADKKRSSTYYEHKERKGGNNDPRIGYLRQSICAIFGYHPHYI